MLDYLRPPKSRKRIKRDAGAALLLIACASPVLGAEQDQQDAPSKFAIYARLNASYERFSVTDRGGTWNVVDNASLLGFRDSRDVGDGLTAFFQIETRIRVDTGETFWASRGSYVGLQGAYGTGRLGRVAGPVFRRLYEYISLHNNAAGSSADAFIAGTVTGNQGIMNNAFWYTSPDFGAVRLHATYALLGETPLPGMAQPRHVGLVGEYDTESLHFAVARADTRRTSDLGDGTPSQDIAYTVGGLYRMPWIVVGGLVERAHSRLLSDEARRGYVRAMAMIPVHQHEIHFNVGRVNHRLDAVTGNDGAVQWTVAYAYNFDAKTRVYTFYTVVNNDTNGNYGFSTHLPGVDNKSIALGVRYLF